MKIGRGYAVIAALAVLGLSSAAMASDPTGKYRRKNNDLVQVWVAEGKLYCKIVEGKKLNFEMCHGMTPEGEAWKGKKMKHPSMPGFMTFNGTVTMEGTAIKIKGCALGNSMCDSETWTKVD